MRGHIYREEKISLLPLLYDKVNRFCVGCLARDRTLSEVSNSSAVDKPSKNPHAGLEKSCKDLQRQTVSLQRLKTVFNEQLEKSFKRISEVFKELHNQ